MSQVTTCIADWRKVWKGGGLEATAPLPTLLEGVLGKLEAGHLSDPQMYFFADFHQ